MELNDKVTFSFGKETKEGVVVKVFPKTVFLRVDFPNHEGKIIKRKIANLQGEGTKRGSKKSK